MKKTLVISLALALLMGWSLNAKAETFGVKINKIKKLINTKDNNSVTPIAKLKKVKVFKTTKENNLTLKNTGESKQNTGNTTLTSSAKGSAVSAFSSSVSKKTGEGTIGHKNNNLASGLASFAKAEKIKKNNYSKEIGKLPTIEVQKFR